jgi:hypothetical protein
MREIGDIIKFKALVGSDYTNQAVIKQVDNPKQREDYIRVFVLDGHFAGTMIRMTEEDICE